jgi:hypothetical protein
MWSFFKTECWNRDYSVKFLLIFSAPVRTIKWKLACGVLWAQVKLLSPFFSELINSQQCVIHILIPLSEYLTRKNLHFFLHGNIKNSMYCLRRHFGNRIISSELWHYNFPELLQQIFTLPTQFQCTTTCYNLCHTSANQRKSLRACTLNMVSKLHI